MIPKKTNATKLILPLIAAVLLLPLMASDALASEAASGSIQRSLGALVYLSLPLIFYFLMRGPRRRHGVLLPSSRQRLHARHRASRNGY